MHFTAILNKDVTDITDLFVFSSLLLMIFKRALAPSRKLNHNAYLIFPHVHVKRESMACGTKAHFSFARA